MGFDSSRGYYWICFVVIIWLPLLVISRGSFLALFVFLGIIKVEFLNPDFSQKFSTNFSEKNFPFFSSFSDRFLARNLHINRWLITKTQSLQFKFVKLIAGLPVFMLKLYKNTIFIWWIQIFVVPLHRLTKSKAQ